MPNIKQILLDTSYANSPFVRKVAVLALKHFVKDYDVKQRLEYISTQDNFNISVKGFSGKSLDAVTQAKNDYFLVRSAAKNILSTSH